MLQEVRVSTGRIKETLETFDSATLWLCCQLKDVRRANVLGHASRFSVSVTKMEMILNALEKVGAVSFPLSFPPETGQEHERITSPLHQRQHSFFLLIHSRVRPKLLIVEFVLYTSAKIIRCIQPVRESTCSFICHCKNTNTKIQKQLKVFYPNTFSGRSQKSNCACN